ncbi:hypothetical protein SAMN05216266_12424 [Amycolatopsis marina]|uniref:Uncharacterized protein n=2 Tax=Amycolatopsis marina TaxID=490629 RepID=A0A1I1CAE9_9PSEU|nr:hypothetical protein SAMN05216266_12424 [Amycolatopsis marina]
MIVALSTSTRHVDLQGIAAMNRTAPALTPTQQAWVAVFATTVTLLLVILLGAAG